MTMIKKVILALPLAMVLYSCNKDTSENLNSTSQTILIQKEGVVDGRYHFSSSESLSQTVAEMRENDALLAQTMKTLYLEGFRSKSPIGDIENDQELIRIYNKPSLTSRSLNEDEDEMDEEEGSLIADPVLSSYVNEDNEIVVDNVIYKFTPKGIFFSSLKDIEKLYSYLETIDKEELSKEEVLRLREYSYGNTQVSDGVFRFIAPITEEERAILDKERNQMVQRTPIEDLQPIIGNLPLTNGKNNWFLHTITGQSTVSEDYFDRRHRVKTEFWNQNYGFYKSVGISVRNQVRRLRVWWASDADELSLGINYIHLKYKIPTAPMPQAYVNFNTNPNPLTYMYKGQIYFDNTSGSIINTLRTEKIELPFFKFNNREVLNIFIPNIPVIGGRVNYSLHTNDILSQGNIAEIYKQGIKMLKSMAPEQKEFVAVKENKFQNEFDVVYFTERYQATNTNKIKKHISRDYGVFLGLEMVGKNSQGFSYSPIIGVPPLKSYSVIKVDFYGMARRGNQWKGARLVF
ncbi:hypothetical protein CKY20_00960 [Capnocytophaga canis]|uniref:Uncharacterized protein n=2 Tax=Capnocytophaga canis TaxID=1848903 RepID=A0A3A1YQ61_9FLAO|nr:hypothetical protein CKY20_00960 [Capnocytophaga canis]